MSSASGAPPPSVLRVIWQRPFLRAACVGLFISGIGVSSTMPQMSLFLVTELHISIQMAGLYYLVNLMAPIAGFVVGSLSERFTNRLFLYRCCAILGAIGWTTMALARQPWMPFVIGATVLAFAGGSMGQLFAATRDELNRDPTPVNSRIISAVRMCFSAGWIVGPVVGSWFGAAFGLRPLLIATAGCLVAQIIPFGTRRVERTSVSPPPSTTSDGPRGSTPASRAPVNSYGTRNPLTPLLIFLGCCVLVMNGDTMKFAYLPLYMDNELQLSDTLRGTVIAVQPFLELLLMPFFARLADKITPIRVVTLAALLGVAANIAYATSTSVTGLFVGQILMSGVWAAVAGLGITVAQQLHPTKIGLASSMYSSCIPLAGALGGSLGALGVGWLGIPHVFVIPAALTALGFVGMLVTARRFRPDDSVFTATS